MQRNQLLVLGLAVVVATALFAFGRITPKVHEHEHAAAPGGADAAGDGPGGGCR